MPVPVRWDVPEWELARVREVIEPRVYLSRGRPAVDRRDRRPPTCPTCPMSSRHMQGICSSGSTGTPKIILSELAGRVQPRLQHALRRAWMPIPRPQTILVLAPMYHVNAFTTLHSLLAGDRLVVMEKFDAARALELIERHGISTFTATPTMLQRMADVPGVDERDLSSLVWIIQGAAPMPPSLVHRWAGLIGAERIIMAYGMTEGIGITAFAATSGWPPGDRRTRACGDRDADPRPGRNDVPPARSATSSCARRPTAARATSATRRPSRETADGFPTVATSATSTTTATSTWPTAAST